MQNIAASIPPLPALAAVGVRAQINSIFAQKVVEEIKVAHSEITGLELAATTRKIIATAGMDFKLEAGRPTQHFPREPEH